MYIADYKPPNVRLQIGGEQGFLLEWHGTYPNRFHRWMQGLLLGWKWTIKHED